MSKDKTKKLLELISALIAICTLLFTAFWQFYSLEKRISLGEDRDLYTQEQLKALEKRIDESNNQQNIAFVNYQQSLEKRIDYFQSELNKIGDGLEQLNINVARLAGRNGEN